MQLKICLFFISTILKLATTQRIQELYRSTGGPAPWPPGGASWEDSPASWPGHLKQLGSEHPRTRVEVYSKPGFPGAKEFYNEYVAKHKPVLFNKGCSEMTLETLSSLNGSGLAAITFLDVLLPNGKPRGDRSSLRNFKKNVRKGEVHFSSHLDTNTKRYVTLPKCLVCSYLTPLLQSTWHSFRGQPHAYPVTRETTDLISCLIDGQKEVLLVNPREYPDIESVLDFHTTIGTSMSSLNSLEVDYSQYPGAAKVGQYYIARLEQGDCLYVPGGWITQSNVLSLENSVDLRWSGEPWVPDDDCIKAVSFKAKLSQFDFKGENYSGIEPSRDKFGKGLKKSMHVLDWMLQEELNQKMFNGKLKRDRELLPDLRSWTPECSARAQEMLQLLDLNKDGLLSVSDIDTITEENLPRILGHMDDRLADLLDIAADQKLPGAAKSQADPPSAETVKLMMARDEL